MRNMLYIIFYTIAGVKAS